MFHSIVDLITYFSVHHFKHKLFHLKRYADYEPINTIDAIKLLDTGSFNIKYQPSSTEYIIKMLLENPMQR